MSFTMTKTMTACLILSVAACAPTTEDKPAAKPATTTAATGQSTVAKTSTKKATLASLPALASNKSRLIIYRSSYLGLAVQPKIFVNGRETGRCTPGTVIAVDLPAGEHTISSTTETKRTSAITLSPGSTSYVNCRITTGIAIGRATFEQVTENEALAKASNMRLQGQF